jgi:hypothetical protein
VDENDVTSVVHFVESGVFKTFLDDAQKAAENASAFFQNLSVDAFKSITSDRNVQGYFARIFGRKMTWEIRSAGFPDEKYLGLEVGGFDFTGGKLIIELGGDANAAITTKLNADENLRAKVSD